MKLSTASALRVHDFLAASSQEKLSPKRMLEVSRAKRHFEKKIGPEVETRSGLVSRVQDPDDEMTEEMANAEWAGIASEEKEVDPPSVDESILEELGEDIFEKIGIPDGAFEPFVRLIDQLFFAE